MFSDTKETETDALWWRGNASKLEVSKRPGCRADPILPYQWVSEGTLSTACNQGKQTDSRTKTLRSHR
jgi:hypothetical protein